MISKYVFYNQGLVSSLDGKISFYFGEWYLGVSLTIILYETCNILKAIVWSNNSCWDGTEVLCILNFTVAI